jgi:hypothetical protein
LAKFVVGLQILQQEGVITLSPATYVASIVADLSTGDNHTATIPLAGGEVSAIVSATAKGEVFPPADATAYKCIIGKVMDAMVATRPDIAFAVGFLGRYAAKPNKQHYKAAENLIRYLHAFPDVSTQYRRGSGKILLHGYVDADWRVAEDRKSTNAYIFMVGGSLISWQSKCQQTVALSSTEAEYMVTKEVTKKVIWLRRLLADLGHTQKGLTLLYEDNTATIALALNPVHHS